MHRIWSYQDYVSHLSHSSSLVRTWAFKKISEQYPRRFAQEVGMLIGDQDEFLACRAPKYLAEHGAEEFAPAILESFLNSNGMVASNCAVALGMLKYEPAFDALTERFRNVEDIEIFLGIIPTTIFIFEVPTSFYDVKGKPDDFSLGSTLPHQARFGYRTA